MMKSLERLKKYVAANTDESYALTLYPLQYGVRCTTVVNDLIDAIEREVEGNYVELPKDANGEPITYDTMTEQWGALDSIWCMMESDDSCTWYVRGHDMSAPIMKASEVTVVKPPTVEDVLKGFTDEILDWAGKSGSVADIGTWGDIASKYASKLQIKGDE